MWDDQLKSIRKKRYKMRQEIQRKAPFHIARIWGELRYSPRPDDEPAVHPVRFILNDFTEKGVSVFSSQSFSQGQRVGLFIPEPRPFYVAAEISACHIMSLKQNVLTDVPLVYRIALRFLSFTAEERRDVRAFCFEANNRFVWRAAGQSL